MPQNSIKQGAVSPVRSAPDSRTLPPQQAPKLAYPAPNRNISYNQVPKAPNIADNRLPTPQVLRPQPAQATSTNLAPEPQKLPERAVQSGPQPQPLPIAPQAPCAVLHAAGPPLEFDALTESQLASLQQIENDFRHQAASPPASAPKAPSAPQRPVPPPQPKASPPQPPSLPQPHVVAIAPIPQAPPRQQQRTPSPETPHAIHPLPDQAMTALRAQRERQRMQMELDNARRTLDTLRKDMANKDLEMKNTSAAVTAQLKASEQENSRLRTQIDFMQADPLVSTAGHPNPPASPRGKPVLTVGRVEMAMPRKNTQQHQQVAQVTPAGRANALSVSKKPSSHAQQQQPLEMAPPPIVADKPVADRSPDRHGSKKRKRNSDLNQSTEQEDLSDAGEDFNSQTLADMMDVDSQPPAQDQVPDGVGWPNGKQRSDKYKKQFNQLRQGVKILQKIFQPSGSNGTNRPATFSAAVSPGDSFAIQFFEKNKDELVGDISSLLDTKFAVFEASLTQSLAKRRKLTDTIDAATAGSDPHAQLAPLQNLLRETACRKTEAEKQLEQAELEVTRLRAQLVTQSERVNSSAQDSQNILRRYDLLDAQLKTERAERHRLEEATETVVAAKDARIQELQGLVANLVTLIEGRQNISLSQILPRAETASQAIQILGPSLAPEEDQIELSPDAPARE